MCSSDLLFRFPRALWAERNALGERLEERPDGSQLRRFTVRRRDPFLRWLLSLGGDAVVAGPDELAEEFQEMVRAVARRYADPEGSGG